MLARLGWCLFGIFLGAGLSVAAYNYHVVRTEGNWLIVARTEPTLVDTYVDIRKWSLQNWREHPRLARALVKAGHGKVIQQSVTDGVLEALPGRTNQTGQSSDLLNR